ncbi:unnamed protein product [Closterium sp. NIES-64]|nr:unnamed protein product [Closterium sp. NIES-64]
MEVIATPPLRAAAPSPSEWQDGGRPRLRAAARCGCAEISLCQTPIGAEGEAEEGEVEGEGEMSAGMGAGEVDDRGWLTAEENRREAEAVRAAVEYRDAEEFLITGIKESANPNYLVSHQSYPSPFIYIRPVCSRPNEGERFLRARNLLVGKADPLKCVRVHMARTEGREYVPVRMRDGGEGSGGEEDEEWGGRAVLEGGGGRGVGGKTAAMRGLSGWARMRAAWALEDRERDAAAAAGAVAAAGGMQLAVEGQGGGEGKGDLQSVGANECAIHGMAPLQVGWCSGGVLVHAAAEAGHMRLHDDVPVAMALAAAEAGHIRLHGDKPTTAEAVLARVRRKPLADERLAKEEELREHLRDLAWPHDTPFGVPTFSCAPPSRVSSPLVAPPTHAPTRLAKEEELRGRLGDLAYYQEWVAAWPHDTSLKAVLVMQGVVRETGRPMEHQVLNMLAMQVGGGGGGTQRKYNAMCERDREYNAMCGWDVRLHKDPLAIRMDKKQWKHVNYEQPTPPCGGLPNAHLVCRCSLCSPPFPPTVWGGDPVYPTVNYEQAPGHGVDNRGPNFNEPSEDPFSVLGKVVTQEQMEAIMTREQEEKEAVSHTS